MNVIRNVALATVVFASAAQMAGAADKVATMITGAITPGVYGRVDMANRTRPPLVYEQPMFIEHPQTEGKVEPVYLHVPPEHAKNWRKYCDDYEACDKPVYFVKSEEYEPGYEPPQEERPKRKFRSGW